MGMGWYVVRRVVFAFFVTFTIVSITWGLLSAAPNPEVRQASTQAALEGGNPAEARENARQRLGLDRPAWERYVDYVVSIYTLEWGWSDTRSQPVTDAIANSLYYTVQYSVPWTILTVLIGPLVGLYSAANQYSWRDHVATGFAFFGYAIPNFFFGIVLLLVFGVELGWIPVIYNTQVPVFSVENIIQLTIPIFVLVTGSVGGITRVARNEAAEYVNSDFVKTARAKGVSVYRIYFQHVLRPTLVPVSTTLVSQLLALFTGASLLVEVVFGIPGLGRLLYNAVLSQDTSVVLGTTLFFTFVATIGNLIQDITYTVLDPRIDFSER
jgi:peptide/nickel transport system permease protein